MMNSRGVVWWMSEAWIQASRSRALVHTTGKGGTAQQPLSVAMAAASQAAADRNQLLAAPTTRPAPISHAFDMALGTMQCKCQIVSHPWLCWQWSDGAQQRHYANAAMDKKMRRQKSRVKQAQHRKAERATKAAAAPVPAALPVQPESGNSQQNTDEAATAASQAHSDQEQRLTSASSASTMAPSNATQAVSHIAEEQATAVGADAGTRTGPSAAFRAPDPADRPSLRPQHNALHPAVTGLLLANMRQSAERALLTLHFR